VLNNPARKYRPFASIDLPDRTWVSQTITHPPIWLSTDLRDGNQALIEPMSVTRKLRLFHLLVQIGFKEIEVAFPSASQTDFDFVRHLIEQDLIPDDVTIQVLTPAREALIRRTFASLIGAKRAIVHLYNATSPIFRRTVFGLDRAGTIEMAVSSARLLQQLAAEQPQTHWRFEYSPETFTATELDFSREICNAVLEVWQPSVDRKAIINLPATVEVATPNVYADQVEWMHRHLAYRDRIVLSVHPHNDRGSGIAAAELAQMAGADRVEGCLFGNGERTGNVDLVTLALNLYTQGIHPQLDFSDINEVARSVEYCNQLPIHPRHPYVGDLVFTAFSGSHQDAIKKGFAAQQPEDDWQIPYLPIDPADLGRSYESVVRVNSQSGKGGIAFLLEQEYGLVLPRRLQIEFSQVVQQVMDTSGMEMTASRLWELFDREYLKVDSPLRYLSHDLSLILSSGSSQSSSEQQIQSISVSVENSMNQWWLTGQGNGAIDALVNALNASLKMDLNVHSYEERSLSRGSDALAIAYVEITGALISGSVYGVGIDPNFTTAALLAVISAVNRGFKRSDGGVQAQLLQQLSLNLQK
jgi:2-isopropylmalate synthase